MRIPLRRAGKRIAVRKLCKFYFLRLLLFSFGTSKRVSRKVEPFPGPGTYPKQKPSEEDSAKPEIRKFDVDGDYKAMTTVSLFLTFS